MSNKDFHWGDYAGWVLLILAVFPVALFMFVQADFFLLLSAINGAALIVLGGVRAALKDTREARMERALAVADKVVSHHVNQFKPGLNDINELRKEAIRKGRLDPLRDYEPEQGVSLKDLDFGDVWTEPNKVSKP